MGKKSPVSIFIAATAILATGSIFTADPGLTNEENSDLGGLKEWTTDQSIDAEWTLDEEAKKQAEKAKKSDVCIPVGEGENCW